MKEGFESKRGLASKFLGTGEAYVSKKKLPGRLKWAEKTHRREYPNDWVVDIRHDVTDADYAMDYTECGICKLCRDEGVPDLAKYLCKLDYVLADLMGLALTRTTTIAEGGTCCDFRYNLR